MVTLYHAPLSRSARFVWLLEELEAPYEVVKVDIARRSGVGARDPKNPHPDGQVPALVHEGELVTESIAIALYLTDLFPKNEIGPLPGDPRRGEYLTWLAYYAGVMEPVLTGSGPGREKVDQRLTRALQKGPYLLGDAFSAADILLASLMQFARNLVPSDKIFDEFLARVTARPAFVRAEARLATYRI